MIPSQLTIALTAALVLSPLSFNLWASANEVDLVRGSDVEWQDLNPARGAQSPRAGTLWGDRKGNEPTGYLFFPKDGFQSPPHIHNVSYRGIVIRGVVHNDDPDAAEMWMGPGSFWTQPKGEPHVTSAMGKNTLAYIEIEEGPYLVHPTEQAFDSGERPINVDSSNLVWLDQSQLTWLSHEQGVQAAYLWGKVTPTTYNGRMVKLPPGFTGQITSSSGDLRAIVISGNPSYTNNGNEYKNLELGSYFGATQVKSHRIASSKEQGTLLYIRALGDIQIVSQ